MPKQIPRISIDPPPPPPKIVSFESDPSRHPAPTFPQIPTNGRYKKKKKKPPFPQTPK